MESNDGQVSGVGLVACNGPLHKGKLIPEIYFRSNNQQTKTCFQCLESAREWKAANPDKVKLQNSWANPDIRFKQNIRRLHIYSSEGLKKEALASLMKPGMGWSNYYVKGKRSWKFVEGLGNDGEDWLIAKWS